MINFFCNAIDFTLALVIHYSCPLSHALSTCPTHVSSSYRNFISLLLAFWNSQSERRYSFSQNTPQKFHILELKLNNFRLQISQILCFSDVHRKFRLLSSSSPKIYTILLNSFSCTIYFSTSMFLFHLIVLL